jgi:general secretion pathway protein A
VAGAGAANPFPRRLMGLIHTLTGGVPRRINLLCDRALLGAYVENAAQVTRPILRRAAAEVFGAGQGVARPRRWPLAAAVVLACAAAGAAGWQLSNQSVRRVPVATVAKAAPPVVKAVAATPVALPAKLDTPAAAIPATPATPAYGSIDDAMPELAQLWDSKLGSGAPCQAALKMNLHCYSGKGSLYELRLLDRPAILTLHDGAQTGYVVLVKLDDSSATLRMNGATQQLSIASVAARFDGQYTTLWSAPRGFRDQVSAADTGADVDWIAAQLAKLNATEAPPLGQAFDARTRQQLRQFQTRQNLKADGLVGPRTYMRLSQLNGVAEPRLLATTARGQ